MSDRDDFEFDDDGQEGSPPSDPPTHEPGVSGHQEDEQAGYGRDQAFEAAAIRGLAHPDDLATQPHPGGLWVLFVTEMWERFSYYGMRALLVLYLVAKMNDPDNPGLGWTREDAGTLYAWYTGLVYLTPLFGGWLADKMLGTHRSMIIGGWIIAAGHFTLALTEVAGKGSAGTITFMAGLVLIIIGTGFFKPCVSVMVGQLYRADDPRRDSAFTIYYMGINVGAFLAGIIAGTLGEKVGWHWGFGSAGVGMVLGILVYSALRPRYLKGIGLPPGDPRNQNLDAIGGDGEIEDVNRPLTRVDWHRLWVIIVLALAVVFFWAAFEQAGSSMNVFANETTDRNVMGMEFPATWYQSVNPLYIVLFAPVFAWFWMWLDKRHLQPRTPTKFALGITLLGLGFGFMVIASLKTAPLPVYKVTLDTDGVQSVMYVDGETGEAGSTFPGKSENGDDDKGPFQAFVEGLVQQERKDFVKDTLTVGRPSYDRATYSAVVESDGVEFTLSGEVELVQSARSKLETAIEDPAVTFENVEYSEPDVDGAIRVTAVLTEAKLKDGETAKTIPLEGDLIWAAINADAFLSEAENLFRNKNASNISFSADEDGARFAATLEIKEGDEKVPYSVTGELLASALMTGEVPRVHENMSEIEGLEGLAYELTDGGVMYTGTITTDDGPIAITGDAVQSYVLTRIEDRPSPMAAINQVADASAGATVQSIELTVDRSRKAGPYWLLLAYLMHTWGELCLSPVGLSMVTKLAAAKIRSLMMGVWFLANFAANLIGGYLFAYSQQISESRYFAWLFGEAVFYVVLMVAPLAVGILVMLISPILKRMMHGLH